MQIYTRFLKFGFSGSFQFSTLKRVVENLKTELPVFRVFKYIYSENLKTELYKNLGLKKHRQGQNKISGYQGIRLIIP